MDAYSIIVLVGAALVLLSTLVLVRRRNHKIQKELQARAEEEVMDLKQIELMRVQNPTEEDVRAYTLIEEERQKVWKSLSVDTSIAPRTIYQLAFDLVRDIAAIYYPDTENPIFKASIFDLLELNYRIIERVKESLDEFPLNTIKDMDIHEILRYKGYYDKITDFKFVKLAQEHKYLYSVGKYAWMGYNALNPWYWGRKVAYTAGKEGTVRYLLSVIITVVGEESVLVYSSRNIRAKAVALEKNIAFEMINMAVADGEVSQKEYEILLDFILGNPRLDDQMKVMLMKAVTRKRSTKTTRSADMYDDKEKRRLLAEVEKVAKADNLGLLKKREALKALEESLAVTSAYRSQLEVTPHAEIQARDLMEHNRRREEALLCLLAQAGALTRPLPDTLKDYIAQRATSYPTSFDDEEQQAIFQETTTPTQLDTLTDLIRAKTDKERALSEILDMLLWYPPFSQEKENFYQQIVTALDLKKSGKTLLHNALRHKLPSDKLIDKPPSDILKLLYRVLEPGEQVVALQHTSTKYRFPVGGKSGKPKDTDSWLVVTSQRVCVLAAVTVDDTFYHHAEIFGDSLHAQIESGRLHDVYRLSDGDHEFRVEKTLFRSSGFKQALQGYIADDDQPALEE